ncbi:MAG: sigma-70 family RNA polymerase sigma factor [Rhodospirillales bacterium]|nr:sigma-70 family RNA polymerase sigma factor [Rhodospirillales bacterium]
MGDRTEFERLFLPHLPAAYNLARWLTRHPADAEDMVQEAYLRAFRAFDRFSGDDGKAWILTIVRNACLTSLKRDSRWRNVVRLDTVDPLELHALVGQANPLGDPEKHLFAKRDGERVRAAIARLPEDLREIIVLREFEELSYAQIARVVDVPVGTVMSRLSRARAHLRELLTEKAEHGQTHKL